MSRIWTIACAITSLLREDMRQFSHPAKASSIDADARQLVLQGVAAELPESLYLLAMMKFYGHGEERDVSAAVHLLRRAAEKRHHDAQFALGVLYGSGDGVVKDDRQSASWLSASASAGHRDAKWMLAILYNEGRGVKENADRAAKLLLEAVDANSADACFHLGVMFEYGRGVPQNFTRAAQLYGQAVGDDRRRVPDASYYLGLLHSQGRGVPRSSTRARECFFEAAELGHAPAMFALAQLYTSGQPGAVDLDLAKALYWLRRAAEASDPRVSVQARAAAEQLESVLEQVERRVREQERLLGVPLRVSVGQIQDSN